MQLNQTSHHFLQETMHHIHQAFTKASTNINEIGGYIGNLPRFVKNIVKYLVSRNTKVMTLQLPATLKRIQDSNSKSRELSHEIVNEYQKVSELLEERINEVRSTKATVEEARETKRKYLSALLELQNHWDSLILFFDRFDFLITFILFPQVEDLNDVIQIKSINLTVALNNGDVLQEVLDRVQSTSLAAIVIHRVTETYLNAENNDFMNKVVRLNDIILNVTANSDNSQLENELIELSANTSNLQDFLENEENSLMHNILDRYIGLETEYRVLFLCTKNSDRKNLGDDPFT